MRVTTCEPLVTARETTVASFVRTSPMEIAIPGGETRTGRIKSPRYSVLTMSAAKLATGDWNSRRMSSGQFAWTRTIPSAWVTTGALNRSISSVRESARRAKAASAVISGP